MPIIYVAMSNAMQEWGADVGASKNLFKVGVTEDDAEGAVEALGADSYAGQADWQLAGKKKADLDEETLLQRIAERHQVLDPLYYPRLKGVKDIVRVDQRKVEADIVIKKTMAGKDAKVPKLKPKDMAAYLIESVL